MINVKEIESFKEYGRCVSISNGVIEALVTVDLGPRIISFGYVGGINFMSSDRSAYTPKQEKAYTDFFGEGRCWENFGGHRIWLSPESDPETYLPDDRKVDYTVTESGALFTPLPDTEVGIVKTMELKMDPDDANMQVIMKVTNIADKPQEFAIWALSVCDKDGTLIVPMNTNDTGLLSNRIISVWPYTDMSDDRIYWGNRYVTLRQGKYPDGGCSFETYTNDVMLEFETLGELKTVNTGETSEHIELWSLCKKPCEVDFKNDDSIDNLLSKI